MRYNILCLYHDEEPQFLAQDPEDILRDHNVTGVHTYEEAKRLLFSPSSPFDIVLSDAIVPHSPQHMDDMGPSILLSSYLNDSVKGFGLFVPRYFES